MRAVGHRPWDGRSAGWPKPGQAASCCRADKWVWRIIILYMLAGDSYYYYYYYYYHSFRPEERLVCLFLAFPLDLYFSILYTNITNDEFLATAGCIVIFITYFSKRLSISLHWSSYYYCSNINKMWKTGLVPKSFDHRLRLCLLNSVYFPSASIYRAKNKPLKTYIIV